MKRTAAIVCVSALAYGCLLFTDIAGLDAEDATDLADGGDGASPETSSSDGTSEAANVDGGSDARTADAAAGCAKSDAAFCADFDDGGLEAGWTALEQTGGGRTLEISNALSRSPSSSFHSVVDRAVINPPPGDCIYARIFRDLSNLGPRTRARVSFDAWPGGANGPPIAGYLLVAHAVSSKGCNFIISLENEGCGVIFQYNRDGGMAEDNLSGTLATPIGKAWTHVDLDLSFDPSAPAWSMSVNGQRCGVEKKMPVECQSAQTLTVAPGIYCVDKGTGLAEVYIDNVEVR